MKIINKLVFIIQIYNVDIIEYYQKIFKKYYFYSNYIIEFYLKNDNICKIQYDDDDKININYVNNNNFIIILEDIYNKYNFHDLIFIIKNNNFNIINIDTEIYHFIYENNLYINNKNFILLNLKIFDNDYKKIYDLLKLNRLIDKSSDIDQNILSYVNINYINNYHFQDLIYNKNVLTKFLIFSEIVESKYFNYCHLFNIIESNNTIKYITYNLKKEILKIEYNNDNNENDENDENDNDSISDIDDFSTDDNENKNEYKINIYSFNQLINKINTNYFFIITNIEDESLNIEDIQNNLENSVIFDKYNDLNILILDTNSLKQIGFLNPYYFKNNLMINLNLFIFNKLLKITFYKSIENKIINTKLIINNKIHRYFDNINFNKIINIRTSINLNNCHNYNNIIDIIIINLKNRSDKKLYMINQMNKLNIINYKFFDAFKLSKEQLNNYDFIKSESFLNNLNINYVLGASGCKISHYELIKNLENNNKFTLILEDDVVLETNFLNYIFTALKQLYEKKFDLLYLGCNLHEQKDNYLISDNILSVKNPKTTSSYIIQNCNKNKIIDTIKDSTNEIDEVYSNSNLIKYCIYPMISYQKNLKSDIVSNNDYGYYHDKFYYD